MKNLILIHGASQQTVETALCEMAKNINILNGDEDNNTSYNYHVDVASPTEGKLFIRMHHDGSFSNGESVSVILHRGLYGMLHAEKIEHK